MSAAMTTVEVANLTGAALDWAVAEVIGAKPYPYKGAFLVMDGISNIPLPKFSTDWAQGGPLIDTGCSLYQCGSETSSAPFWMCSFSTYPERRSQTGETALIAACRAIVAFKLGLSVSVPVELVGGEA